MVPITLISIFPKLLLVNFLILLKLVCKNIEIIQIIQDLLLAQYKSNYNMKDHYINF